MEPKLISRLDNIVGKKFNYKGKNVTIDKYKVVNSTNVVVFFPQPKNMLISEVEDFLDSLFQPLEKEKTETQVMIPQQQLVAFEPTKDNEKIKTTLLETLEKVKADPGYLPQASTICDVVGQFVAIQKNEIQMLSLIKKFK
ncbi:hypothetical protein GJU43_15010 [Flavobacterium sp. LC2016-23]|uniref:hypothetical protein n=1 Tax=Flavobacterium sp. LC2016-23 TaxID=2666330 RepID=UPI0012B04CD7|nr:hypothetical protein [Flavobacterium sp. LC2016-23]MRX40596.1 hypothetical protein [Flavobacterium sp. LC2016-23]